MTRIKLITPEADAPLEHFHGCCIFIHSNSSGTRAANFRLSTLHVTPHLWEYSRCRTLEIVIVDGTIYYLVEVYDISVCHLYLRYYLYMMISFTTDGSLIDIKSNEKKNSPYILIFPGDWMRFRKVGKLSL